MVMVADLSPTHPGEECEPVSRPAAFHGEISL
jgi:hypothetical protein